MRFLIDAQLPRRLSHELANHGHDALHTLDLTLGNKTPDTDIIRLATEDNRILITKDNDFIVSYFLHGLPPKLLLVSTGNISNNQLSALFTEVLPSLEIYFDTYSFIELGQESIVIHA